MLNRADEQLLAGYRSALYTRPALAWGLCGAGALLAAYGANQWRVAAPADRAGAAMAVLVAAQVLAMIAVPVLRGAPFARLVGRVADARAAGRAPDLDADQRARVALLDTIPDPREPPWRRPTAWAGGAGAVLTLLGLARLVEAHASGGSAVPGLALGLVGTVITSLALHRATLGSVARLVRQLGA